MNIRSIICLLACLSFCATTLSAQESRNIDGTGNNLTNTDFGAIHTPLARIMTSGYSDGVSAPAGTDRPNPRIISNALFDQSTSINDVMGLSDFLWAFGQFIDHDIIEVGTNPAEPEMIPVDFNDPWFNPGGNIPNVNIPMFRSMPAPGTGTDAANPRNHLNNITAWLDGSAVYGSEVDRANWLRTYADGKLKTSAGNLLPWNTFSGEKFSDVDPNAPFMADDVGMSTKLFVAGDIRANEQPLLTALHTVFVREHNRICEELILENPSWTDEELYQEARRWVGGIFQAIVFEEWLPAMGVHLPAYTGYNPGLDPSITNVFSAAAFRLGHTLLNGTIQRLDNSGNVIPEGNITLAQAFFNPSVIEDIGLDPYFKGMAAQVEQALDCNVINEVRNFLFGPPGAGGLDLAAININRGRERGLPDLNTIRADLGLAPFVSFDEINSDANVVNQLSSLYTGLDKIDPWVGMLAENPMADALFGETIMEIMIAQFQALRDGDRFYYQHDPAFSNYDRMMIENTTLKDVIMRNTQITLMQENVFLAMDPQDICPASSSTGDISGVVKLSNGSLLENSELITLNAANEVVDNITSDANGNYLLDDLSTCSYYQVKGERNTNDFRKGINSLDIILLIRHIVQLRPETDPVKLAAADVDGDLRITTFDLLELQKLLLHYTNEFPANVPSWRMIPESLATSGVDPYPAFFHPYVDLGLFQEDVAIDWIGYKMGDFSGDVTPNLNDDAKNRNLPFALNIDDQTFQKGETLTLELSAELLQQIYGVQLSLDWDSKGLALQSIEDTPGLMTKIDSDKINLSWFQAELNASQPITITFEALSAGKLSDFIGLSEDGLEHLVVDEAFVDRPLALNFDNETTFAKDFMVYQNRPNPFKESTTISWHQAKAGSTTLEVFTASGQLIYQQEANYDNGYQFLDLTLTDLEESGLLFYRISTLDGAITKRMMAIQ